jgi:hypothetical protein
MRGFVSLSEIWIIKKYPNASCSVQSLQYITCCSTHDRGVIWEQVYEPLCCLTADTCCQPSGSEEDIYVPEELEDNPYLDLFTHENVSDIAVKKLSPRDITVIVAMGSIVLIAISVGIIMACTLHHRVLHDEKYHTHR